MNERNDVMERAMRAKVEQHEDVCRLLKGTGERRLIFSGEDTYWGIGHDRTGKVIYFVKLYFEECSFIIGECDSLYQYRS